jgi:DUF4097 and DUF4098 domain-containing protein YvlB
VKTRAWKEALFADRGRGFAEFLHSLLAGIPWSERAEAEETCSLPVPRRGLLRIDNPHGRTHVVGEERSDLEVRACKVARAESEEAARRLAETIRLRSVETSSATVLEVEVPKRWNRSGNVHLGLRVPRELRVEVSASNARVQIEGLRAALRVHSSNGGICVSDVCGNVAIETSNARVACTGIAGRLVARSANGKIQLEAHRGSVDASTSNGLIHANLEELGREGVKLATSNGRIVLELPETCDADLDLRVDNGVIRNQRPLHPCTRRSGSRLAGRVGAGGVPVKLRATNGSIAVR